MLLQLYIHIIRIIAIIEVLWTPHFIHCEKYVNKNSLNDHKVPLVDRTITVEGIGTFATKELVKSTSLIRELEKASAAIADNLNSIPYFSLSCMKLLFRQDTFDRLQLLLCSSLKLTSDISGNPKRAYDNIKRHTEYDIVLPMHINQGKTQINTRDFKCKRCPICLKEINDNQLYEVNNQTLVEMHKERVSYLFYDGSQNLEKEIPKGIQNLYPGITYKTYLIRKVDPVWLCEVSRVCLNCWTFIIALYYYIFTASKKEQEKENIRKPGNAIEAYSKINTSSYSNKSFFSEMQRSSKVNQNHKKNFISQPTNTRRPSALPPLKPRSTKSKSSVRPDSVDSKVKFNESSKKEGSVNRSNLGRERQSIRSHNSRPRLPKCNVIPRKIHVKYNKSSKGSLSFLNNTKMNIEDFNEYI